MQQITRLRKSSYLYEFNRTGEVELKKYNPTPTIFFNQTGAYGVNVYSNKQNQARGQKFAQLGSGIFIDSAKTSVLTEATYQYQNIREPAFYDRQGNG